MPALRPHPIHPFPARMAPKIALDQCTRVRRQTAHREDAVVLDPMSGSGTVLRVAAERGLHALGFDVDPLAVLLARVWTTQLDTEALVTAGDELAAEAKDLKLSDATLPWMDRETRAFIAYWFGKRQRNDLRRLSALLYPRVEAQADALRVALSRLIITKDRGASLAADVSHSRPHRCHPEADHDFDVLAQFRRSIRYVAQRLDPERLIGSAEVRRGDARSMNELGDETVASIITSPPYLNAIDYLRGHRLALVWMGHRLSELRAIRSGSVGAERAPEPEADLDLARQLMAEVDPKKGLEARRRRMVERYALDVRAFLAEAFRVLESEGEAVLVVGDSTHRGIFVDNTAIVQAAARHVGFTIAHRRRRKLPPGRRYLPPPSRREASALGQRMRMETVLTLVKA